MMSDQASLSFVVLVGSLREGSTHAALARERQAIAPAGITISWLGSVGSIPHYDADHQADGFPLEVTEMGPAIAASDGIIVCTPQYNYSVPGVLKSVLDWLLRLPETPSTGKPVSTMTGSPGPIAGARAQYHLRQIMVFLDTFSLPSPK